MKTAPTALVLGAGASWPYGFPTGLELKQDVIDGLEPGNAVCSVLLELGNREAVLDELRSLLKESPLRSVDACLERHPEFMAIGKQAIAAALLPREDVAAFYQPPRSGAWYDWIYNLLDEDKESWAENRLSVITFNYDRSIQTYLVRAIATDHGISEEAAWQVLQSGVTITPVNGTLGALPWEQPNSEFLPYGEHSKPGPEIVRYAADSIQILPEAAADDEVQEAFVPARQALDEARHVYFLGFGYHRTNMRRLLGTVQGWGDQFVEGSGLGLGDAEREQRRRDWQVLVHAGHVDVLGFLKNRAWMREGP